MAKSDDRLTFDEYLIFQGSKAPRFDSNLGAFDPCLKSFEVGRYPEPISRTLDLVGHQSPMTGAIFTLSALLTIASCRVAGVLLLLLDQECEPTSHIVFFQVQELLIADLVFVSNLLETSKNRLLTSHTLFKSKTMS